MTKSPLARKELTQTPVLILTNQSYNSVYVGIKLRRIDYIIDYYYLYYYQRAVAVALVVVAPRRVQMRKIPGVSLGVPHLNNRETTVRKVSDIFIFIIIREQ